MRRPGWLAGLSHLSDVNEVVLHRVKFGESSGVGSNPGFSSLKGAALYPRDEVVDLGAFVNC